MNYPEKNISSKFFLKLDIFFSLKFLNQYKRKENNKLYFPSIKTIY